MYRLVFALLAVSLTSRCTTMRKSDIAAEALEVEQPIIIRVFHAKNDILTSDEYLSKEMTICSRVNPNRSAVLTTHPQTRCNGNHQLHVINPNLPALALGALQWFNQDFGREIRTHFDFESTINRLKTSIKEVMAKFLWDKYRTVGLSYVDTINNLAPNRFDAQFRSNLQCHFKTIVKRNGTYVEMAWLHNQVIDLKWVVQGMQYIHFGFEEKIKETLEAFMAIPTPQAIQPLISGFFREIAILDEGKFTESVAAVDDLREWITRRGNISLSLSANREFVSRLCIIPQYVAHRAHAFMDLSLFRQIGAIIVRIHHSIPQGGSVNVIVAGNVIAARHVNCLDIFLDGVIKALGWEFKCERESVMI